MAEHPVESNGPPELTREEVIHLLGEVEDVVVTAILRTGASYADVERAQLLAAGDPGDLGKEGLELGPLAEAVYDILTSDPALLEVER